MTVRPNPMQGSVRFDIQDRVPGKIAVSIYDHTGNVIHTVGDADLRPLQWCGTDMVGNQVKPGVYFYQVQMADGSVFNGRIMKVE